MYVGKKLPDFLPSHHRVTFADVQRYSKLTEEYREANLRHRAEVHRLKAQIETLFEELRISKRHVRKPAAGSPEKIFRELVNKYHPDRHRGKTFTAEDVMKDINRLWQKAK
jgi:DnaJ-domain-containing protein 1